MYEYQATVTNVVDGDTIEVAIDLGFHVTIHERVRIYGVDTPERGQPGWAEATAFTTALVTGKTLTANTVKGVDKYGRFLAVLHTVDGLEVAAAIIAAGLGVPYFGGKKV